MSIERLQKTASAAGFAMAAPDDEMVEAGSPARLPPADRVAGVQVPAIVPPRAPSQAQSTDAIAAAAAWLKAYLPTYFGGRAPA